MHYEANKMKPIKLFKKKMKKTTQPTKNSKVLRLFKRYLVPSPSKHTQKLFGSSNKTKCG